MNSCDQFREFLLECDWPQGGLQRAAEAIAHLQSCPACTDAAREFGRLQSALRNENEGAPSGGWSAFEKRLIETTAKRSGYVRRPWMALAASVLIAAGGYGIGRWATGRGAIPHDVAMTQSHDPVATASDGLSQTDIQRRVKAFDEVSGVFEHRATWLLVGDNTSDMGVSNRAIDRGHQVLLLRLTMKHSQKTISTADLVILPGQAASLTVPAEGTDNLRYRIRTSSDQPTRLVISTQLMTSSGTEALAALETTLQIRPGQKLSAGSMVTDAGDYELQIAFGRSELDQGEPSGQRPSP
jgi:hypothetical protein